MTNILIILFINKHDCLSSFNVQSVKKKKIAYFNTNYRKEMKLIPVIMDYCQLQFDTLKFLLRVR